MTSKVSRRSFVKYVGAGLVAATAAGAGYYLYSKQKEYAPTGTITIPKGWETATTWLKKTSLVRTTATLPEGEWWKSAKVVTASVDYWNLGGKQYVEDAGIEVIDWLGGPYVAGTPAWGYLKYDRSLVDEAHSRGLMIRPHELPLVTLHGDYVFTGGEVYVPDSGNAGERIRYPLRALYQSRYWSRYFGEKWRNPDGSIMEDPVEGAFARNLHYEIVESAEWGVTYLSLHNPYYLDYVKKCLQILVDTGFDGVNFDFVSQSAFGHWLGGDFSPWAEYAFREHLSKSYSEKQLSGMGIDDLGGFSLRNYIQNKGYIDGVEVDDPILRTWSSFEYRTFDQFLRAVCDHLRSYSNSKGKERFGVSGNQYNLRTACSPFQIMGSEHFDVIWQEEDGQRLPSFSPPYRMSLLVKQGWALSRYRKPVWQHLCAATKELGHYLTEDYAELLGILFAQVYSVGGVYLADRLYWIASTAPVWVHPMKPRSVKLMTEYCSFVRDNKQFFIDARPSRSAVAIAYSLPTMMMGYYPSLGVIRSWEWDLAPMGLAHVLDREHVPFDFIIFGHPQFWDDSDALASLPDYDVLALSNAEAMSEEQAAAIRRFVEQGGALLSFGAVATRDEDCSPRKRPALVDLTKPGLNKVREGTTLHLSGNPAYRYWRNVAEDRKEDSTNYKTIRDAITSLIRSPPSIETNASDTVSISLLQQGDRSFQVHLVNLDYDESDDSVKEKDCIRIKATLPSGFPIDGKVGRLMTPDGNGKSERLEYTLFDGYVEFEIPYLRIYSIATIYDPACFQ